MRFFFTRSNRSEHKILTSSYGKVFDFSIQVVPVDEEDDAEVEDHQRQHQVGQAPAFTPKSL